jgi:GTP-binding protein
MHIHQATFVSSSTNYQQCPLPDKPEVAFIGRSNVGKSSLINMLVGRKKLAKTSATPGKTQLINHFLINEAYYLVDLPGYGWAQVSRTKRVRWSEMASQYLLHRKNLVEVFVLIDIRLTPQQIDLDFIQWLSQHQIPFSIVMTKADKVSKQQALRQVSNFKQALANLVRPTVHYWLTSSVNQLGREEVMKYIQNLISRVAPYHIPTLTL